MEETLNSQGLLDVIRILSFKGESGRLQISVGATRGTFFFKKGQLVDARMGPLTGFPAVNAAVSIQGARFSFDPSISPPTSSFNTLNERTVLKQLFGIETVDPEACNDQVTVTVTGGEPTFSREAQRMAAGFCEPIDEEAGKNLEENAGRSISEQETIAQTSSLAVRPVPSSQSRYRKDLYVAILLVLTGAGAVALVQELNERRSPTSAAEPRESSLPRRTEVSNQIEQRNSGTQNLTGQWKVVNIIQKTTYRSFTNLKIGFRLLINQTGTDFTAEGEKVSENGRILPAARRTPIHVTGSIDGERVQAIFMEEGLRRKTSGRFIWRIENAGAGLSGTFVSTAARTSGASDATKEL